MYPTLKDTAELSSATAESDANAEGNKIALESTNPNNLLISVFIFTLLLYIMLN